MCNIMLGRIVLPGTNTLAYWAHSQGSKKIKCCENSVNVLKFVGALLKWACRAVWKKYGCRSALATAINYEHKRLITLVQWPILLKIYICKICLHQDKQQCPCNYASLLTHVLAYFCLSHQLTYKMFLTLAPVACIIKVLQS